MVKDINGGGRDSSHRLTPIGTPSFSWPTTEPTEGIVEERWNVLRHGDGQGHQPSASLAVLPPTSRSLGTPFVFRADDGTNGTELWALDPANITGLSGGSGSGSGGGMTNVTGATCSISPSLPAGLSIDSSTCTISGTPTVASSNTTYTVTAVISGVTYQTTVWLSSLNRQLTPSVEGADLLIDEAMTNITFQYDTNGQASSSIVGPYNGNGTAWMVIATSADGADSVYVADMEPGATP